MKFDVHGTSHVCYNSLCCQSRLRHKLVAKLSEQTQLWYMITPAAGKQSIQNAFVSCLVYSGWWSQITHTKPSTIHWIFKIDDIVYFIFVFSNVLFVEKTFVSAFTICIMYIPHAFITVYMITSCNTPLN